MHEIDVKAGLLAPNDAVAAENRHLLAERGLYAVNVMSAPGSGKTSLLERVLPMLAERHRVGVEVHVTSRPLVIASPPLPVPKLLLQPTRGWCTTCFTT